MVYPKEGISPNIGFSEYYRVPPTPENIITACTSFALVYSHAAAMREFWRLEDILISSKLDVVRGDIIYAQGKSVMHARLAVAHLYPDGLINGFPPTIQGDIEGENSLRILADLHKRDTESLYNAAFKAAQALETVTPFDLRWIIDYGFTYSTLKQLEDERGEIGLKRENTLSYLLSLV